MAGQPSVPGIPEGSVVITPAEVYNEVRDLNNAVRELLTKEQAEKRERAEDRAKVAALELRVDAKFLDHEGRIRTLEQRVWLASGFAAAVGSAVATFVTRSLS